MIKHLKAHGHGQELGPQSQLVSFLFSFNFYLDLVGTLGLAMLGGDKRREDRRSPNRDLH